jgi:magnesium chelatase subunit I
MQQRAVFPFVAIVGQEKMKLALILNIINPTLSGVLIRGEKGTAKSTAVRALADILPAIEWCRTARSSSIPGELEVCRGCPQIECSRKMLNHEAGGYSVTGVSGWWSCRWAPPKTGWWAPWTWSTP